MKIATWNVNSARARLPHITAWLAEATPDVLLLQETKSTDENFPFDELKSAGYETAHHGQKSYNGVAIVSRLPMSDVQKGMKSRPDDPQARVVSATVEYASKTASGKSAAKSGKKALRVISAYVPNGQKVDSEKYHYKLSWLESFSDELVAAREKYGAVAVGGDYNIAPEDNDVYDIADWGEDILTSPGERRAFRDLLSAGYADAHRMFEQPDDVFSWWDYRQNSFVRNRGLRIDLFLLTADVSCSSCLPDVTPRGWERPSDHAPVVAEID